MAAWFLTLLANKATELIILIIVMVTARLLKRMVPVTESGPTPEPTLQEDRPGIPAVAARSQSTQTSSSDYSRAPCPVPQ